MQNVPTWLSLVYDNKGEELEGGVCGHFVPPPLFKRLSFESRQED